MYHLLLIVTAAVLTPSVSLGQENEKKQVHINKFIQPSFKKLNDDISLDLTPQAQSYFIEPELPSSTTVKPTFKRRKTLRPISSLTEKKRPSLTSEDDPESTRLPSAPFNPFTQIVNTGFAKKRPSPQRTKSGVGEESNPSADLNNNYPEVNDIRTATTEGIPEQTTPREVLRRKKSKSAFGIPSTPAPQLKINSKPNRFLSPRRANVNSRSTLATDSVTPSTVPKSTVFTSDSREVSIRSTSFTTSPASRSNRGGRQGGGFVLRPTQASLSDGVASVKNESTKLIRRRKKPSAETSTSASYSEQNDTEPKEPRLVVKSDVPTGRKIPLGLQRRPSSRTKLPELIISDPPVDLIPSNFPLKGRVRERGEITSPLTDSVHESSDTVNAAVLSPEGEAADTALSNAPPMDVTSDVNYRPRNLSNRNPNPLDKLSNRQAAARRFLTPKEKKPNEEVATLTPVVHSPASLLKKTPFSLRNLKNRRLGPAGAISTSTTEVSVIEEVPAGLDAPGNSTAAGFDKEGNKSEDDEKKPEEGEDGDSPEELKEASTSPPSTLPGKRRPPVLPGGRKPVIPRVPNRKGNNVVSTTTTAKPALETTPTPACEDGKKYNKILRKCIPAYAPRSG